MGTRADFYVGRGESAEWLGSIAWDGYPDGIDDALLKSSDEAAYRQAVATFLGGRSDKTLPAQGWPWPWENSSTTDYAYAFDDGKVYASCFGHAWFDPTVAQEEETDGGKCAVFPDMSATKQREKFGPHSGVIVVSA